MLPVKPFGFRLLSHEKQTDESVFQSNLITQPLTGSGEFIAVAWINSTV